MFVVVAYHHVLEQPGGRGKLYVSADRFREHCAVLAEFSVSGGMAEARSSARPSVVVTVDDGYMNFIENALPILSEFSIPCTAYVSTGKVGAAVYEPDYGTVQYYMSHADLELAIRTGLVRVECHGHSHGRLTELTSTELRVEIRKAKRLIEPIIGGPPADFCYPYGAVSRNVVEVLRTEGFETAVTTIEGVNTAATDRFQLRRIAAEGQWSGREIREILQARLSEPSGERDGGS